MTADIQFFKEENKDFYDWGVTPQGDFITKESFDTAILYSIFGERRASQSEVAAPQFRRGWVGNEGQDFENGSKLWLYEQSRITRTVLNSINSSALDALRWFVNDGLLQNIEANTTLQNGAVVIEITLYRFNSKVERKFFELWNNTGV